MEANGKSCCNCRYAIQHYAKLRGRLIKLNEFIHCSCSNTPKKQFEKCLRENSACGYWQNGEERLEKEKTDMKKLLVKISGQLEEIIMILREENDGNRHFSVD